MLVSIITINLNNRDGLKQTLASIFNQRIQDFKLIESIVIDGESTDGSVEIIKSYEDQISFWVSEKDNGIYDAMNKGLQHTSGEYVWFLNSGDYFSDDNALKSMLNVLRNEQQYDLVYSDIILENTTCQRKLEQPENIDFSFLLLKMLNHQSYVLKRKYFFLPEAFDRKYRIVADWVFLFELFTKYNLKSFKIRDYLVVYNTEGMSINSGDLWIKERDAYLEERYSAWELDSLKLLARLRSKSYFALLIASLDSPKRTKLVSLFLKSLYPGHIRKV